MAKPVFRTREGGVGSVHGDLCWCCRVFGMWEQVPEIWAGSAGFFECAGTKAVVKKSIG